MSLLQPAPISGGFFMEDYWVWGGGAVECDDGRYHLFASRWPKKYPFFIGYIFYSEVVRAVADSPEGPFEFAEVVLPARGEEYWDGRMTHNPTIHRYGDLYLLFYIGSTFDGTGPVPEEMQSPMTDEMRAWRNRAYGNIRIGMATALSPEGPWTRLDEPVLLPRPDYWDNLITTNPAPCVMDDGSILLLYRSNTPGGTRIGVARADTLGAPFVRLRDHHLDFFAEDPYIWHQDGKFHMLAKDQGGELTGERHAGVHAVSEDGINWRLAEHPKAYSRQVLWDNGQVMEMAHLERPQLLILEGKPAYLYLATADGPGADEQVRGWDVADNTWNMVIPLLHPRTTNMMR